MTGALIILSVTILTGLILYLTHKETDGETVATPSATVAGEGCCGRHAVCEKVPGIDTPVYFDDEELDRYAGREPDGYSAEEVEEFREVLYTLLPEDVYPWGASLTVRDIALPTELRDEWVMLVENK